MWWWLWINWPLRGLRTVGVGLGKALIGDIHNGFAFFTFMYTFTVFKMWLDCFIGKSTASRTR